MFCSVLIMIFRGRAAKKPSCGKLTGAAVHDFSLFSCSISGSLIPEMPCEMLCFCFFVFFSWRGSPLMSLHVWQHVVINNWFPQTNKISWGIFFFFCLVSFSSVGSFFFFWSEIKFGACSSARWDFTTFPCESPVNTSCSVKPPPLSKSHWDKPDPSRSI